MRGRPSAVVALVFLSLSGQRVEAQQRRDREPNSVYAERRAKLASQVDAPIILWGFTGREEISQDYVFAQEENFYYLTGHNEEGGKFFFFRQRTPIKRNGTASVCRLRIPASRRAQGSRA